MSIKTEISIIFIVAIILRFISALSPVGVPTHDDSGYDERAMSILRDGLYGENKRPTAFKPPLYSFFLFVVYLIFGHSYFAVRIIQSILGALTCAVIYFIAFRLIGKRAALAAGLLSAINFSFIKSSMFLLSESFFTFLISLTILYLIKLNQAHTLRSRVWIGVLAGLGILTRSEMIFFLPFMYSMWLCLARLRKYSKRVFLKDMLITLAISVFIASLWTVRNWRIYHAFVPLTTSVGINLYSSYCPPEGKLFGLTANDNIVKLSRNLNNDVEESKFLVKQTFKFIKENPKKLPYIEFLKLAFFWSAFDWEIIEKGSFNFSYGFILPFFIWAFFANIKKWEEYFLLYMPILYFQALALIFYGSPRFRIPCEPFIIIFSAMGIIYFFQKFSNKILPFALLTAFLFLNITGYLYSQLLTGYLKCALIKIGLW